MGKLINANDNGFIGVSIQYRVSFDCTFLDTLLTDVNVAWCFRLLGQ